MDEILKQLKLDKNMTREDAASNRAAIEKLVDAGAPAVEHLVGRLADNGDPAAQVALHAMAFTVGAPGREAQHKVFVDALAAQLKRDLPQGAKYFVIEQLQLTGGRQAVAAIAAHLDDAALADPACRALARIGGEEAKALLREALPKAKGRSRLSIIQALTILGDRQSLDEFRKTAKDESRDARVLALFSLADLGDAESIDLILASTSAQSRFERMQNFRAALRLGQRLGEAGKLAEAKRVYQEIMRRAAGEHESHVKQAAARGLLALTQS